MIVCDICGKRYIERPGKRIICVHSETVEIKANPMQMPCLHRGKDCGTVDCGCNGTTRIYACDLHSECSLRKVPKGNFQKVKICLDCDDRQAYQNKPIGFALVCASKMGGVETWLRAMLAEDVAGVATYEEPKIENLNVPIYTKTFEELAEVCSHVFVWGIVQPLPRGPKYFAVHHGDETSTWGNSVFRKQLSWCHGGIAINPKVAEKFGVKYLPNPIEISRSFPQENMRLDPTKKYVLWNHRVASEKRPEFALQIAAKLPSPWKMLFSGSASGENVIALNGIAHPGDWLAHSSAFLSTADQEGFGYACAEAIIAGVPVVSSPYGIGATMYPELVCSLSDSPEKWVEKILLADKVCPTTRAEVAKTLHSNHAPATVRRLWREHIKTA